MNKRVYWLGMIGLLAISACGSDDSNAPPASAPVVESSNEGVERGRQLTGLVPAETESTAPAASDEASVPMGSDAGVAPAPVLDGGTSSTPRPNAPPVAGPPVVEPPVANEPPVAPNEPLPMDSAGGECSGKSEGDTCGVPACQSQTHAWQGRCDGNQKCVQVKVKCEKSCEGGACVDEKPGNGNDAKGEKAKD